MGYSRLVMLSVCLGAVSQASVDRRFRGVYGRTTRFFLCAFPGYFRDPIGSSRRPYQDVRVAFLPLPLLARSRTWFFGEFFFWEGVMLEYRDEYLDKKVNKGTT